MLPITFIKTNNTILIDGIYNRGEWVKIKWNSLYHLHSYLKSKTVIKYNFFFNGSVIFGKKQC